MSSGKKNYYFGDSDEEEDINTDAKGFEAEIDRAMRNLLTIGEQRRHEALGRTQDLLAQTPEGRAARERAKEAEDKRRQEVSRLMKQGATDLSAGPRVTFPDGPVIALSLDAGGGTRTIIQLEMLDLLMKEIRKSLGFRSTDPSVVLRPCEVFHLIVGTGTGGLIAILLGRLRMSVQEVTEFYTGFEEAVFGPLREVDNVLEVPVAKKDEVADNIAKKITELLEVRATGTHLRGDENPQLGKVLVTAVRESEKDTFFISEFRSHTCRANVDFPAGTEGSIIDAVQATIPHTVFSKPSIVETATDGMFRKRYGFNPIKLATEEISLTSTNGVRMGSDERIVVSIGAGEETDKGKNEGRLKGGEPEKMSLDQVLDWGALLSSRTEHDRKYLLLTVDRSIKHFRVNRLVDRPIDPKDPDNIQLTDEVNRAAHAIIGARRKCILHNNPALNPPLFRD
ncbi:FabD/lysophospholipase-like protein [Coniochaeta ligniaria NRRL 30616]|uniref:FabD/lysophospholipase-like protein n=1 Tax=Coniochaeta ligniaria NRRL 30616 TaxID=1408157 RepID=A0A1J7J3P3_9PEZI|nr:FabD/lysophospholipase-like protein [Coniochaeta ligniaria NRRL 30616]